MIVARVFTSFLGAACASWTGWISAARPNFKMFPNFKDIFFHVILKTTIRIYKKADSNIITLKEHFTPELKGCPHFEVSINNDLYLSYYYGFIRHRLCTL